MDLIKGPNGVFDVEIDGKLVYSKSNTSRFPNRGELLTCLLYTSDAADEEDSVDLGGRRIIKKTWSTILLKSKRK